MTERNIKIYPWAVNEDKLDRAVNELKASGENYTEEDVKALYIKFAGKVKEVEAVEEEAVEKPSKKSKKDKDESEE